MQHKISDIQDIVERVNTGKAAKLRYDRAASKETGLFIFTLEGNKGNFPVVLGPDLDLFELDLTEAYHLVT